MQTTLCIDPGIRNLSLIIMNSDYTIKLWDTFNILEDDNYLCKGVFKNGKICNRKCSMKYKLDENISFSCKTHFPKKITKTKVNHFKRKNIDEYLLQDIAITFLNKLDKLIESNEIFKSLTSIFIELQPKCNPKSLFVSHLLYFKFIELYKNDIPIKFVRASQKLKAYTGPKIECKLKGKYAQRKFLSIEYGRWFLENKFSEEQRNKWLPTLTGKIDDRNDCLLMAINAITGVPKTKNKKGNCIK